MNNTKLHQETKLGALKLRNKFVVAPLTRMRADQTTAVPTDLMVEYYSQRAAYFGLIITECSQISPLSNSFPGSGGIYNKEQTMGWKKVVDAVHKKGGQIILQIWHSGRSVSSSQINGQTPIAPSPIAINSKNYVCNEPYSLPREMTHQDIKEVIQQFKRGAQNAKEAGFDGIELHAANGYLVDQFLRDSSNQRTDQYGGSIQNRCRFLFEVLDSLCEVYDSDRIGVRLSPTGRYNGQYDSNPMELMKYLLGELSSRNLAFVELKRHGINDKHPNPTITDPQIQMPDFFNQLRPLYKGNIIANDGVGIEEANKLTNEGTAQAVSFGVLSIANPDLPLRVKNGWQINETKDRATWFGGDAKGYTDYELHKIEKKQNKVTRCFGLF